MRNEIKEEINNEIRFNNENDLSNLLLKRSKNSINSMIILKFSNESNNGQTIIKNRSNDITINEYASSTKVINEPKLSLNSKIIHEYKRKRY